MKKKKQIISKREKDAHAGPGMKPHGHPQDMSFEPLSELLSQGYNRVIWHLSESHDPATCPSNICETLDGTEFDLQIILDETKHGASIFSISHVGCLCSLEVISTTNPELEPVWVSSGGYGIGTPAPVEIKGF